MPYKTLFSRARLAISVLAVVVALGGTPVSATVVERGRFSDQGSFSYDDCGFLVNVDFEFTSKFRIRQGKRKTASAFFLLDNLTYREVHTNAETGEWFLIRGRAIFNETKATRVEGSIFKFESVEAGQPFVVENSAGEIVLRDRGAIRRTILFDTQGDDQPGGEEIAILDVDVRGPHPGFFADFCDLVNELIGP
jgi:hypothetical protein